MILFSCPDLSERCVGIHTRMACEALTGAEQSRGLAEEVVCGD